MDKLVSIDDLLNSADSDEDLSSHGLQLEDILHGSDDDSSSDVIPTVLSEYRVPEYLSTNRNDTTLSSANEVLALPSSTATGRLEIDHYLEELEDEDNEVDSDSRPLASSNADSALERCEQKERRFLQGGNRESITALQSKRKKQLIGSYSNIKFDVLEVVSNQLKRNFNFKQQGPGAAASICMHERYAAIGTTRGLIILFDHNQEIRQVIGASNTVNNRPVEVVTSIDISASGAMIICGYSSGEIALWDVAKGVILKRINDVHKSKVVKVALVHSIGSSIYGCAVNKPGVPSQHADMPLLSGLFEPGETNQADISAQIENCLNAVSMDAAGVLQRLRFAKSAMWSSSYNCESECLLDGSAGGISEVAVLPPFAEVFKNSISLHRKVPKTLATTAPTMHFVRENASSQFIAICLSSQTCVVQLAPAVRIVRKWPCDSSAAHSVNTSDWTWTFFDEQGKKENDVASLSSEWQNMTLPLLVRSCSNKLEVLTVRNSDAPTAPSIVSQMQDQQLQLVQDSSSEAEVASAFPSTRKSFMSGSFRHNLSGKASETANATGTANEARTSLVFTVLFERVIPDAEVVLVRWINSDRLVVLTTQHIMIFNHYLTAIDRSSMEPMVYSAILEARNSSMISLSHTNLTVVVGMNCMYFLLNEMVLRMELQSCFELANKLIHDGQWLEALALILENVSKTPSLLMTDQTTIDRYIRKYVELAAKQPTISSVASFAAGVAGAGVANAQSQSHYSSTRSHKNHHHLVAGVCIEYCICAHRLQLLYGELYCIFVAAQQQRYFLDALEPFILSRAITSLPMHLMTDFSAALIQCGKSRTAALERCVLHFDLSSSDLDLDFLADFSLEKNMLSGFAFVCAVGRRDLCGCFYALFLKAIATTTTTVGGGSDAGDDNKHVEETALKLLLFLKYCFNDTAFPIGDHIEYDFSSLCSLIKMVCGETVGRFGSESKQTSAAVPPSSPALQLRFPVLAYFAAIDYRSLLLVLFEGLCKLEDRRSCEDRRIRTNEVVGSNGAKTSAIVYDNSLTEVVDHIYNFSVTSQQSAAALDTFFEFFLEAIINMQAAFDTRLVTDLTRYCDLAYRRRLRTRVYYEDKMTMFAERQSKLGKFAAEIRHAMCSNNFWIAALSIKFTAANNLENTSVQYKNAIQFYLQLAKNNSAESKIDQHEAEHALRERLMVFDYIDVQFSHSLLTPPYDDGTALDADAEEQTNGDHLLTLEVCRVLMELYRVHPGRTKDTVCKYFVNAENIAAVMASTQSDLKAQFDVLKALLSTIENDTLASRSIKDLFSSQIILQYFKLIAVFEPDLALPFVRKHAEHCPLDDFLLVTQERNIPDATAALLQRKGDVETAIDILLKNYSAQIKQAKREIDNQLRFDLSSESAYKSPRNSVSLISQILSKQGATRMELTTRLPVYKVILNLINCAGDVCWEQSLLDVEANPSLWFRVFDHLLQERQLVRSGTISSSGEIIVVLIGQSLQALMAKMKGGSSSPSVAPQDIIRRITWHGSAAGIRLNEFRDVMLSMLEASEFELQLHRSVTGMIYSDITRMHQEKSRKARRACYRWDNHESSHKLFTEDTGVDNSNSKSDGEVSGVHKAFIGTALSTDEFDQTYLRKSSIQHRLISSRRHCKVVHGEVMRKDVMTHATLLNCTMPVTLSAVGFGTNGNQSGLGAEEEFESRRPGSLPFTATFKAEIIYGETT